MIQKWKKKKREPFSHAVYLFLHAVRSIHCDQNHLNTHHVVITICTQELLGVYQGFKDGVTH